MLVLEHDPNLYSKPLDSEPTLDSHERVRHRVRHNESKGFVSARWVSHHIGRDVILVGFYLSVTSASAVLRFHSVLYWVAPYVLESFALRLLRSMWHMWAAVLWGKHEGLLAGSHKGCETLCCLWVLYGKKQTRKEHLENRNSIGYNTDISRGNTRKRYHIEGSKFTNSLMSFHYTIIH